MNNDSLVVLDVVYKSHEFYWYAFSSLVCVIGVLVAIVLVIQFKFSKQIISRIADEKAAEAVKKAEERLEGKFIQLKQETSYLWKEFIMDFFISAKREKNDVDAVSKLISLILKISSYVEMSQTDFIIDDVLMELEARIPKLEFKPGFDRFADMFVASLNDLEFSVSKKHLSEDEKKKYSAKIRCLINVLNKRASEFSSR